jgi:amidohydrolase
MHSSATRTSIGRLTLPWRDVTTDAGASARARVDAAQRELVALSHRIHAHPELKFEEERSSDWTASLCADFGLAVERGVGALPTAFVARAGSGPLHIAICAEYDALPAVGHACGHNVIAASAVGAGAALAPLADDLGVTISVIGTPAEEGGGGKVYLLERGVFDGVHASMMVHPAPNDGLRPRISAVSHLDVECTGKESHAAAAPQLGINAADALTIAQVAIGLLRQHLRPTDQVHGIVTHGGDAANIVPAHTRADFMVRATTVEQLAEVKPRILRCFEAGALATGATVSVREVSPDYSQMVHDDDLLELYRAATEPMGRRYDGTEITFSTDMGNVSLAMPSIHPTIALESAGAVNHQPEFAAACINASADRAVGEAALGMALTVIGAATGTTRERLLARGAYHHEPR